MKKAFAVVSLAIWSLGLFIGIGFAVMGEVDGNNRWPGERVALAQEISSLEVKQQTLLSKIKAERTSQQEELARSLSMAGRLMLPLPQTGHLIALGRSPHEE